MGQRRARKIFDKLFIPIALILIVFVIVSYASNYLSIDRFVKSEATEDITEAFDDIKGQLNEFRRSGETEFKLQVSSPLINRGNDAKVYVYDENYNEVAVFDNSVYINREMTSFLSDLLMNYELEENVLTTINFNGREYLANTYIASDSLQIEEKYFVVIQDLTEKKAFIRESLRSVIVLQILILIAAVLVVYKIARDLAKPIINLADESKSYVVGKGVTIDSENIDIDEVETLRNNLYEMQQNIDKESKRKNTVYENVAHDLRTPLVSILGYADGLKSGIIKDKNKACDIIIRTGNELKEMIENILMLSRFDNDTYKSTYENVDVYDFITEQVELMKVIDSEKKLSFKSECDNTVIYTDRKLLTRIIQNILSNAIKYAKTKVEIILKKGEPVLNIVIADDGEGISDKDLNNIFTRYYKGDNGHFGIGLAVAKNAISILGGDIKVESEKGKGTAFTIIF